MRTYHQLALAMSSVAVVMILTIPVQTWSGSSSPPGVNAIVTSAHGAPVVSASLASAGSLSPHNSSPFYALLLIDTGLGLTSLTTLGRYLNSTPIDTFRLFDGGASYDPTTQIDWTPPLLGGLYVGVSVTLVNFPWFQSWCYSRTPHCTWIADLPAESNNSAAALHFAQYYHNVLHFAPTYWDFGNEPEAWTHYGINLTKWSTRDNSAPTGLDYATMVKNYINAIRAVFPNDQFIGIQASCACTPSLPQPVVAIDGARLAAYAYHDYPGITNASTSLSQFYGSLRSMQNIVNTTSIFRTILNGSCAGCGNAPVELGEYQSGPYYAFSPYSLRYPGAAFIAASVIQALDANIQMFDIFNSNEVWNYSTNSPNAEGILYSHILANMTMGGGTALRVVARGVGGAFAVFMTSGAHKSLFIVNTNTTYAIDVTVSSSLFPTTGSGSTYTWSPSLLLPKASRGFTLATSYLVPTQGILLVDNY